MHDLEQQALDDPFLADALEGLQTQSGETIRQDLSELRTRLDTRVATKPAAIPWRAIRVAAAVILLAGLGFTAYYTQFDHQVTAPPTAAAPPSPTAPPALAKTAAPPAATNPANSNTDTVSAKPHSGLIDSRSVVSSARRSAYRQPQADKEEKAEKALPAPAAQQFSDSLAYITAGLAKDTSRFIASQLGESKEIPALHDVTIRIRGANSDAKPGANPHLMAVSGRVLDLKQRPLAGASLTFKSKGNVTEAVTDEQGQFSFYIPQKDTTRQLTVMLPGYQETQYALNTNEQAGNTIYLRPDQAALSEVVVSGIGAKRKEFLTETVSDKPEKLDSFWLNTAPAMGRIAYLNYLASARKTIPVDSTIHGTESISFRVDKKGALTEFRIERSLSPAHDAGVIRLITEGPPWKMLHGRSARALVDVLF